MLTKPLTFTLYRKKDISGISGTGYVAVGVEFPSGNIIIEWIVGDHRSIEIHNSMDDLLAIHGHNGSTEVHYG